MSAREHNERPDADASIAEPESTHPHLQITREEPITERRSRPSHPTILAATEPHSVVGCEQPVTPSWTILAVTTNGDHILA